MFLLFLQAWSNLFTTAVSVITQEAAGYPRFEKMYPIRYCIVSSRPEQIKSHLQTVLSEN